MIRLLLNVTYLDNTSQRNPPEIIRNNYVRVIHGPAPTIMMIIIHADNSLPDLIGPHSQQII